ncbi:hypothetical protein NOJ28_11200 [Neorhizobium galegae]|uniref:hypothetical protein n=1 Tax=Neorhizobium galegae TaxID=399 RepID=UPI0021042926|nr:hypothetical protein [Neorhizobium galegae]MCQ1766102.1 hypothetical protein [Neorhizobium galegae]MCQ1845016.1 hypothetical protein [Neorhizobium galegae]
MQRCSQRLFPVGLLCSTNSPASAGFFLSEDDATAMPEDNVKQKLSAKAPGLFATAIFLTIIPHVLLVLGIEGFAVNLTLFLLSLAVCAGGLATGRFRIFWWCWGVASLAFFLLLGMMSPAGMVLILPVLLSNWLDPM